jgi:hypothetical protein
VADCGRFAPAGRDELTRWAGPDAGPPAPAVATDPTREGVGGLSTAAAHAVAVGRFGPAAAKATWTLIAWDAATAVVDGRRLLVVDESDPYGCFTSLGLYQLVGCQVCGGEHALAVRPAATTPPARQGYARWHTRHTEMPARPGFPDAPRHHNLEGADRWCCSCWRCWPP